MIYLQTFSSLYCILAAALLLLSPLATTKMNPGGPYISISANIVSVCLLVIFGLPLIALGQTRLNLYRRLALYLASGVLVFIIAMSWLATYSFAISPFNRGKMFGL
mgnify:CR=1 FL=1